MATSHLIIQSYLNTSSETIDKLRVDHLLAYNREKKGGDLLIPLNFYLNVLNDTDAISLHYMSDARKQLLLRDLKIAYLLLLAEHQYEQTHQKYENLKTYSEQIKRCQKFIDLLNYKNYCEEQGNQPAPDYDWGTDGHLMKYQGIFLGQCLAQKMVQCMNGSTKTVRDAMSALNEKRLYWVWGSAFLKTVLSLMPPDFFNIEQANKAITLPDKYTGTLSWTLYYCRFALNLSLLLKHTIAGPWMSNEEKAIPWTERFTTQWDQRKFALLNDSLWATANLVCFFWLTGKGVLGAWGDALTLALLVFDLSITIWDFAEQQTKHNKEMLAYSEDIKILDETIKNMTAQLAENEIKDKETLKQLREYQHQLAALKKAQNQCEREWRFQKIGLINNLSYAIGLMLAFALMTAPFLPITGAALITIGVVGAVLCFAFSAIYSAVKGGIEIYKAHAATKEAKQEYQSKVESLTLKLKEHDIDLNEKKFLFLEIKKLRAETEYQRQLVVLHSMHLVRSIILETLLPAVIFVSLVFLPLGVGVGVLGAVIALAFCANLIINKIFTPKKEELTELDENEFQRFCDNPQDWDKKPSQSTTTFFKSKDTPSISEQENAPTGLDKI